MRDADTSHELLGALKSRGGGVWRRLETWNRAYEEALRAAEAGVPARPASAGTWVGHVIVGLGVRVPRTAHQFATALVADTVGGPVRCAGGSMGPARWLVAVDRT